MIAHHWELRADLLPLERAAIRWAEVSERVGQRADEIVDAARRTLEGWDAAGSESYERHRRQVILNLDQFTTLADGMSNSLRALGELLSACQKELDRAWLNVAMVPHDLVGPDRVLVFEPASDNDRELVRRCTEEAQSIRRRLTLSLGQESDRMQRARAEFALVRSSLVELSGGAFDFSPVSGLLASAGGVPGNHSTSVSGSAQSGVGAMPGLGPITSTSVAMPHLTGLSSTPGLASALGGMAAGTAAQRSSDRAPGGNTPPMAGGMGAGGAGAMRGGSSMRGGSGGSAGSRRTGGGSGRVAAPKLSGAAGNGSVAAGRGAGAGRSTGPGVARSTESEAAKESKRAAIEAKRAERAARKAERDKGGRPKNRSDEDQRDEDQRDEDQHDEDQRDESPEDSVEPIPTTIRIVEAAPDRTRRSDRL